MKSLKWLLWISLQLFIVTPLFSQELITNPIEIRRDDETTVNYYLQLEEQGSHTKDLLVILQGSDCNSVRKIKTIQKLAEVYPGADILTVEKYGINEELSYSSEVERSDCPSGYIENDNPQQRVSDLNKVTTVLRNKYMYERVIVVGGSEGAVIAYMLAASADYIDAVVLFGSGGRFFIDDVVHSMKFAITSEKELAESIKGFKQLSEHILSNGPFEISMSNHGYSWWRTMLSLDQQEFLKRIAIPVLVVQGGQDRSASPEKATEMVDSLKKTGKNNIDYYFYPDHDHALNLSLADNSASLVIDDIKNWLKGKMN